MWRRGASERGGVGCVGARGRRSVGAFFMGVLCTDELRMDKPWTGASHMGMLHTTERRGGVRVGGWGVDMADLYRQDGFID